MLRLDVLIHYFTRNTLNYPCRQQQPPPHGLYPLPMRLRRAQHLWGWKFGVPVTGYIGMVPLEAKKRGAVVAVKGARVPLVLMTSWAV